MELHKLSVDEMRSFDKARIIGVRHEIQRELVNIRMDIYTARAQHSGRVRGLKKSLARLLTITEEQKRPAGGAAAKASAGVAAKKTVAKPATAAKAKTKTNAKTKKVKSS